MTTLTMTSLEAQNKFGTLIDASQREPVVVTRHGRPVSVMISVHDLLKFPFSVAKTISELSPLHGNEASQAMQEFFSKRKAATPQDDLTEDDITRLVHELK